jgi:hypothetical protein
MSDDGLHDEDVDMADSDEELDDEEIDGSDSIGMFIAGAPPQEQEEPREEDSAILRRRQIQAVMRDTSLSAEGKRLAIQNIMSGGRIEVAAPPTPVIPDQDNSTCVHYERNCNVVSPCCGRVFGCRVCHDEISPSSHPPIDRFMICEVVCKQCNTRQSASYVGHGGDALRNS